MYFIYQSAFVSKMFNKDHPLLGANSLGVEAYAGLYAEFASAQDLRAIMAEYDFNSQPWFILGGGNNVLFQNKYYPGLIVHSSSRGVKIVGEKDSLTLVRVEAGEEWDDVVAWCVERELGGIENLSLIPGYAGAAPVQNIGAYGVELKDILESVEIFDVETQNVTTLPASGCRFGYRDSIFKGSLKGKAIILSITLALKNEPHYNICYGDLNEKVAQKGVPTLRNIRDAVIEIRQSKLPDPKILGNAGSFFKNPVVSPEVARELAEKWPGIPVYSHGENTKLAAGWMIDKAGWKGKRIGNVGMHEKQALVLVNYGGASGGEIISFADMICNDIFSKFGVHIEPEVNIL